MAMDLSYFATICYYLYWTLRLLHVHVKGVSLDSISIL